MKRKIPIVRIPKKFKKNLKTKWTQETYNIDKSGSCELCEADTWACRTCPFDQFSKNGNSGCSCWLRKITGCRFEWGKIPTKLFFKILKKRALKYIEWV